VFLHHFIAFRPSGNIYFGRLSPGKLLQGWVSYTNTPCITPGSSSMICLVAVSSALNIPIPLTSLASITGQTIDSKPSARSAKFLRPCSQIICFTSARPIPGPALRMTAVNVFAVGNNCIMYSSVMVVIQFSFKTTIYFLFATGLLIIEGLKYFIEPGLKPMRFH